jgi:putative FmdB family regulatory protein
MPIYAYSCSNPECRHTQDILRKISDPPLVICTACNQPTFIKQVTSAGFALKGTGWYVTDFREKNTNVASSAQTSPATSTPPAAINPASSTPVSSAQ